MAFDTHPTKGLSKGLYSVEATAARLGLHPVTVRFWEECFHRELSVPRDQDGEPLFTRDHLDTIRRIERTILLEGHTVEEARRLLFLSSERVPDDSTGASREIDRLKASISSLHSHIDALIDETRTLHRFLQRLIGEGGLHSPARSKGAIIHPSDD